MESNVWEAGSWHSVSRTHAVGRHLILLCSPPCPLQPKRDGQTLLTQVWRRLNLTECDYFGLEFQHPRSYWVRVPVLLLQAGSRGVRATDRARGHGEPSRTHCSDRHCPLLVCSYQLYGAGADCVCFLTKPSSHPP